MKKNVQSSVLMWVLISAAVLILFIPGCTLEPPYVYGRVTDNVTGGLLSGVTVSLQGKTVTSQSNTYQNNNYAIDALTPGVSEITATMNGYFPYSASITVPGGDSSLLHNISMLPSIGTVTGRVTNSTTGVALSGVTVTIGSSSTTTNTSGNFTINNLQAGDQTITASLTGYETYTGVVTVLGGRTVTHNIALVQITYGRVRGQVTDAFSGAALANVAVTIATLSGTTNGGGNYNINNVPAGQRLITGVLAGYTNYSALIQVLAINNNVHNFVMVPKTFYVTNILDNNCSVFRASNNSPVVSIPSLNSPTGLALRPNSQQLYITSQGDNRVYILNTATNAIEGSVETGASPTGIAINLMGTHAYVTNQGDNTLSVIRLSDNQVIATVDTQVKPLIPSVTPDGAYVYVTNLESDSVSVIRTSDNQPVTTVSTGEGPMYVRVSPDGQFAYVSNFFSGTISVISTVNNTVVGTISGQSYPTGMQFSPDGSRLYVCNITQNTVTVINTANWQVLTTVNVGYGPWHPAISSDGKLLYVTNQFDDTVSIVDTDTYAVTATVPTGFNPWEVIPSP